MAADHGTSAPRRLVRPRRPRPARTAALAPVRHRPRRRRRAPWPSSPVVAIYLAARHGYRAPAPRRGCPPGRSRSSAPTWRCSRCCCRCPRCAGRTTPSPTTTARTPGSRSASRCCSASGSSTPTRSSGAACTSACTRATAALLILTVGGMHLAMVIGAMVFLLLTAFRTLGGQFSSSNRRGRGSPPACSGTSPSPSTACSGTRSTSRSRSARTSCSPLARSSSTARCRSRSWRPSSTPSPRPTMPWAWRRSPGAATLGYKGRVGDHVGYGILVAAGGVVLFLGGVASAIRDGDPEAHRAGRRPDDVPRRSRCRRHLLLARPRGLRRGHHRPRRGREVALLHPRPDHPRPRGRRVDRAGLVRPGHRRRRSPTAPRATGMLNPIEIPVHRAIGIALFVLSISRVLLAHPRGRQLLRVRWRAGSWSSYRHPAQRPAPAGRSVVTTLLVLGAVIIIAGGVAGLVHGQRRIEREKHGPAPLPPQGSEHRSRQRARRPLHRGDPMTHRRRRRPCRRRPVHRARALAAWSWPAWPSPSAGARTTPSRTRSSPRATTPAPSSTWCCRCSPSPAWCSSSWSAAPLLIAAKYRVPSDAEFADEDMPPQIHGNSKLEIGWTVLPSLILLASASPRSWRVHARQGAAAVQNPRVEVVGAAVVVGVPLRRQPRRQVQRDHHRQRDGDPRGHRHRPAPVPATSPTASGSPSSTASATSCRATRPSSTSRPTTPASTTASAP